MLRRLRTYLRHNIVACVALFFALSGTAVAAKPLITGADVEDGSLRGADVSNESTLTGVDIDESDLSKVPSAVNADLAANADKLDGKDASELGGAKGFSNTNTDLRVPMLGDLVSVTIRQDEPGGLLQLEGAVTFDARTTPDAHVFCVFEQRDRAIIEGPIYGWFSSDAELGTISMTNSVRLPTSGSFPASYRIAVICFNQTVGVGDINILVDFSAINATVLPPSAS